MQCSKRSSFIVLTIACILFSGCKQDLSKEAKKLLSMGALAAKERAVSFSTYRHMIVAKAESDSVTIKRYLDLHEEGLIFDAKSAHNFLTAFQKTKPNKQSIEALKVFAKGATARAQNWKHMKDKLKLDGAEEEESDLVLDTHYEGLKALSETMELFVKELGKDNGKSKSESEKEVK